MGDGEGGGEWANEPKYDGEKACSSIIITILSARFHGHLPSKLKQEKTVGELGGHKRGYKTVIQTFFTHSTRQIFMKKKRTTVASNYQTAGFSSIQSFKIIYNQKLRLLVYPAVSEVAASSKRAFFY
jgi:hypothetical protein